MLVTHGAVKVQVAATISKAEAQEENIYSVEDIARILSRHGSHYFDADTRHHFRSRTYSTIYPAPKAGAVLFVESTQFFSPSTGPAARRYTVRAWRPDAPDSIATIGGFEAFASKRAADAAARKFAALEVLPEKH